MYFVEKSRNTNLAKRFDYMLFISVLILTGIGILAVRSATIVMPFNASGSRMMITQIAGIIIGIISALIINAVDYKDFKFLGWIYYWCCIGLLILVLFVGTGDKIGSRSWIKIGPIQLQPAELTKVAFIVVVSIFLQRIKDGNYSLNDILKLCIFSSLPILLIVAQRDFGTTMVFVFMLFMMIFICGIPYKFFLMLGGAFVSSLPVVWFFILNETRKDRIRVFFNPELDPRGAGYNVIKSKIAIGSGEIFGQGLFKGIQTQNVGVPVRESDFIFTVIGEELGLIGAGIVILLIFFIMLRGIYIASNAPDNYGAFLVTGVVAMYAFHAFENIGMTMGLLPVTGVPLPFISHGATSMIANYLALGIVLSVSLRRKKTIFNE